MNARTDIKGLLKRVDLAGIVQRDMPALAGYDLASRVRHAPCPMCGGRDRFNFRLGKDGIGRVYCTHCAPSGLDAIGYLQWARGWDFKTALEALSNTITATPVPQWGASPVQADQVDQVQIDHAPGQQWQAHARAFVDACAELLFTPAGESALAYLHSRKLTDETIRRFKVGYNPTMKQARGLGWGLHEDVTVTAVAGITIPREILGDLWAVNIRRMNRDGTPYKGADKYIAVTGSKLGLWGADSLAGAQTCISFGGEFDAILAAQHAPPGVACVSFGGESRTITQPWRNMLDAMRAVYVCLDNDEAGDQGSTRWAVIDSARRVRVPQGKDLTEFAQMGGDVANWIDDATGGDELTEAVIEWAESKGYVVSIGADGHWLACRGVS